MKTLMKCTMCVAGLAALPVNAAADVGTDNLPVADVTADSWPVEIINRPLTLPLGSFSAGLGLSTGSDFSEFSTEAIGLWGLSYGVSDRLSVGLGYGLDVEPSSDGKGPLALNLGYTYYSEGALSLAGTLSGGYDLTAEVITPAVLGTYAWYNLSEEVTVISPGGQLEIGIEDPQAVSLSLPMSVGYQATTNLFATIDTNLMPTLAFSGGDNQYFAKDVLPLGLSGYYSPSDALDIGLSVSADAVASSLSDSVSMGLSLIYYGGV